MTERECTECRILKSIETEFYNSKRTVCKDCAIDKAKSRQKVVSGKVLELLREVINIQTTVLENQSTIMESQSTIMESQKKLEKRISSRMDNLEVTMEHKVDKLTRRIKKLSVKSS